MRFSFSSTFLSALFAVVGATALAPSAKAVIYGGISGIYSDNTVYSNGWSPFVYGGFDLGYLNANVTHGLELQVGMADWRADGSVSPNNSFRATVDTFPILFNYRIQGHLGRGLHAYAGAGAGITYISGRFNTEFGTVVFSENSEGESIPTVQTTRNSGKDRAYPLSAQVFFGLSYEFFPGFHGLTGYRFMWQDSYTLSEDGLRVPIGSNNANSWEIGLQVRF